MVKITSIDFFFVVKKYFEQYFILSKTPIINEFNGYNFTPNKAAVKLKKEAAIKEKGWLHCVFSR